MIRFLKIILISTVLIFSGNTTYSRTHTITIVADKFVPAQIEISVGDTVTWVNKTGDYHTSTSGVDCNGDGNWDSGIIENGKRFTHVFKKKGSFPYFCMPHCRFGMKGLVSVVDANKSNEKKTSNADKPSNNKSNLKSNSKLRGSAASSVHKRFAKIENCVFEPVAFRSSLRRRVEWPDESYFAV